MSFHIYSNATNALEDMTIDEGHFVQNVIIYIIISAWQVFESYNTINTSVQAHYWVAGETLLPNCVTGTAEILIEDLHGDFAWQSQGKLLYELDAMDRRDDYFRVYA